jgi:hypothetical protein
MVLNLRVLQQVERTLLSQRAEKTHPSVPVRRKEFLFGN